ncbi:hypothetical protein RFI_23109 [Reticulomyxa filosa]|uniref:Uncharacterized protein n=1 Tax=Reticulomyxa filosa TaxID=46433 RepID=X6MMF0_RETFI|nr:hypothetical protein RFI_23109 [Reticulomyxa filosa]|eukprot:ETO14260.1 hypothetical protein RFI_23109 [Reticulomyxa filosa]
MRSIVIFILYYLFKKDFQACADKLKEDCGIVLRHWQKENTILYLHISKKAKKSFYNGNVEEKKKDDYLLSNLGKITEKMKTELKKCGIKLYSISNMYTAKEYLSMHWSKYTILYLNKFSMRKIFKYVKRSTRRFIRVNSKK